MVWWYGLIEAWHGMVEVWYGMRPRTISRTSTRLLAAGHEGSPFPMRLAVVSCRTGLQTQGMLGSKGISTAPLVDGLDRRTEPVDLACGMCSRTHVRDLACFLATSTCEHLATAPRIHILPGDMHTTATTIPTQQKQNKKKVHTWER